MASLELLTQKNNKLENPKERLDQFLETPPNQPKADIAEYVESEGICVPQRFKTLDEAIANEKPFIIRSEHPHEYAGSSGIMDSLVMDKATLKMNKKAINQLIKKFEEKNLKRAKQYCDLANLDFEKFKQQISYSYWEIIPGYNRSIIADSAVPERYHIFTQGFSQEEINRFTRNHGTSQDISRKIRNSYVVVELTDEGEPNIIFSSGFSLDAAPKLMINLKKDIDFYESIRRLDKFNPNHCYLAELQTALNEEMTNFFLQSHCTIDNAPDTNNYDKPLSEQRPEDVLGEGAIQAEFVRGTTNGNVITLITCLCTILNQEQETPDASFNINENDMLIELNSRARIAIFTFLKDLNASHSIRSRLFKPEISIIVKDDILPENIISLAGLLKEEGKNLQIPILVISDGKTCFVKMPSEKTINELMETALEENS